MINSQSCENAFRDARAGSHGHVNFDFAEFLQHLNRSTAEQVIKGVQGQRGVRFPSHNRKAWDLGEHSHTPDYLSDDVTAEGLLGAVHRGYELAIKTLNTCGIVYTPLVESPSDEDLCVDLSSEIELLHCSEEEGPNVRLLLPYSHSF
jgi:hypothetical protein